MSLILIASNLISLIFSLKVRNKSKSKTSTRYIVNKGLTEDNNISELNSNTNDEQNEVIMNNEDIDSFMNREDSDLVESSSYNSENSSKSNEANQLQEQEKESKHDQINSSTDSDLVDASGNDNNDHFAKENNNNMTNFVELNPRMKKKGLKGPLPVMNNSNYAYSAESKEKNEIQKAIQTAHSNKIANELLKRKINVSIPERIESSFKRYRAKHGETQDDFTAFLGYLKDASERASIKMSLRKKMLTDGYVADKIKRG